MGTRDHECSVRVCMGKESHTASRLGRSCANRFSRRDSKCDAGFALEAVSAHQKDCRGTGRETVYVLHRCQKTLVTGWH